MTRLITRNELSRMNRTELQGLYRQLFNDMTRSRPNTYERRNALASLENIQNALAIRYLC